MIKISWEEVKKINSDFTKEPLNFNNYINDISTFGKYSYVLDPENINLWRSLIGQSLTLFGHSAIHETVYERLTDEDVDYMIRHNVRLGQAFNSFYDSSAFASGDIDAILNTITSGSYNVLETKLQYGINRYISEMTSGDTAGTWLGTLFSVDVLKEKTDIASIISDTTLWTDIIMSNESLRYVVCLSASTIDWFANNDSTVYVDFITEVCNSTKATTDLFTALNGNDKLATFMDTESVFSIVASKTESMIAITYMTAPFAAMIASETAMNIVVNSDVAIDVIVDSMTNVTNSENVLSTIKTNLTSIEESLPSIANSETNISEVADVKEHIADVVTSLQKTTSQADILISNITAMVTNSTAMTAIAYSATARQAVQNSLEACNAINTILTAVSSCVMSCRSIWQYNEVGLCWIISAVGNTNAPNYTAVIHTLDGDFGVGVRSSTKVVNRFSDKIGLKTNYTNNSNKKKQKYVTIGG